jgi:hypothetical protein
MANKPTLDEMRLALTKVMPKRQRDANLKKFLSPSQIKNKLYHATPKDFKEFQGEGFDPTISGNATWLSTDPKHQPAMHNISGGRNAQFREGTNVMPVHVQAKNPLHLDDKGMLEWARQAFAKGHSEFPDLLTPDTVKALKEEGYDSIIHADPYKNGRAHEVIMLQPNKIKSAIGNRGTYDPNDPDITKAKGGEVMPHHQREANKAKFLENSKVKERMYHGTDKDFREFRHGRIGTFVTPKSKFASDWSTDYANDNEESKKGANVMPVHVQVNNPFDYENHEHLKHLRGLAKIKYPSEHHIVHSEINRMAHPDNSDNNFGYVEHPDVQKLIKASGHDAFYVSENGIKNLSIYDPKKIKSAIGNRGTYDTNESDITKAKGGIVSLKEMEEYIRQKRGEHGAKRVQRAADEIPSLENMYTPKALKFTFERPDSALMSMNPQDFEKYAERLQDRFTDEQATRHTRTGSQVSFNDYMNHLANIKGGFDEVPFLELGHRDPEYLPSIEGHEGRHRSRALVSKGVKKSLVQLMPSDRLGLTMGLTMPKKNNEKLVQKMKQTLGANRYVSPQGSTLLPSDPNAKMYKWLEENNFLDKNRPQLPEIYNKGGNVMPKYPSIEEMLQKLQESGRTPIMPAPDRWFKHPQKHPYQQKAIEKLLAYTGHQREDFPHGAHINPVTGEPLDFEIMNDLGVAIDPETGAPRMSGIKSGLTEIDPKLGSLTKSNLIRKGLFKHEGGDPLLDRIKFLATIEKSGKGHHYGLSTHYESPAELVQEMRGNPTLRPHSRGDIYGVGDEVGRISIKGMHHPVFEKLIVAPSGMDVQGKKLHKAKGGITHAHHLEIEERPL